MQAIATMTTSKRRTLFPLAAAIGLLAIVSVIAYLNWNSGSQSEAARHPAAANTSQAAAEARFRAINELPASVSAARPAAANLRFLAMNLLPETLVADGTLSGQALYRFLEWNGAASVTPRTTESYYPAIDRDNNPN